MREQREKDKAFQAWQGKARMRLDTETKIHIEGFSKIKERHRENMEVVWI